MMMTTMGPRRLSVMLVALMIAAVCVAAQPAAAADDCTYSFQNNEAPDLKIKTVIDGKEVTQILLTSGRTESITVSSDDTVVVRRPSDRERLFRASGCDGAGAVIELGDLPADIDVDCQVEQAAPRSEDFRVDVQLGEAPAGSYVAIKAYNPVDDEDYVFLGSSRTRGNTNISLDKSIADQPGDWRITARIRLADGSKLPRVDCAIITIGDGGEIPAGAIGNASVEGLATSCWAVDRQLADGTTVSDVTILNAGDPRVIYARSENSFLGRIDSAGENYDTDIAVIKVRGGERQGTYECAREWTGAIEIPSLEDDGVDRVDVEVLLAVPAANGGTTVLWQIGASGPGFGNGGAMSWTQHVTNTLDGQRGSPRFGEIAQVTADLIDCDQRYAALTSSEFGSTNVELIDLRTGEYLEVPRFKQIEFDNPQTDYGFDCQGRFWFETRDDGVDFVSLD